MTNPTTTVPGPLRPGAAAAVALLVCGALLFPAASAQGQDANEQRIWEAAEPALLDYMERSAAFIAEGHTLAHRSFITWYADEFLPSLDSDPPIAKVAQAAFLAALKVGGALLPVPGAAAGIVVEIFSSAFKTATSTIEPDLTPAQYRAKLDVHLSKVSVSLLALADRFERDHPDLFEDAMTTYLREELETSGIHAASEFRLGEGTRAKMHTLGFPKPDSTTAFEVAERILIPMVLATKRQYHASNQTSLEGEELAIDARITARRILYPHDPKHYCEGAWQLGWFRPDDCR